MLRLNQGLAYKSFSDLQEQKTVRRSVENYISYVYTTTVSKRRAVGHVSGRRRLIQQQILPNREVETTTLRLIV